MCQDPHDTNVLIGVYFPLTKGNCGLHFHYSAREKLEACRTKIEALEAELVDVQNEIELSKESGNNAAYYRLISHSKKLDLEIHNEYEVEAFIKAELQIAE